MSQRVSSLVFACAICAASLPASAAEPAAPAATAPQAQPLFANIDGRHSISAEAFKAAVNAGYRQKFYHAQPPEAEYKSFLKEIALRMIDDVLLPEEAQRRGLAADNAAVEAKLAQLEARYGNSPDWAKRREQAFPGLRKEFERQSQVARLEAQIKDLPQAPAATVEAYYNSHQTLFTEPVRYRVSMILLAVDPSSPESAWQATHKRGEDLRQQILGGASFADLARRHSNDPTGEDGGNMGYVHQGQLSEEVQLRLAEAKAGSVLSPIRTLQGVIIVRLDELVPAKLRSFDEVKERAAALYRREATEQAWKDFLSKLRKSSRVEIGAEFRDIVGAEFARQ